MSIRKAIRQIQNLRPAQAYAIVFEHKLDAQELEQLRSICEKAHIRALLLTDARVIRLDLVAGLVAKTDEAAAQELIKGTGAAGG